MCISAAEAAQEMDDMAAWGVTHLRDNVIPIQPQPEAASAVAMFDEDDQSHGLTFRESADLVLYVVTVWTAVLGFAFWVAS